MFNVGSLAYYNVTQTARIWSDLVFIPCNVMESAIFF